MLNNCNRSKIIIVTDQKFSIEILCFFLSQLNILLVYICIYDSDCYDDNHKPLLKIEYHKTELPYPTCTVH